MFDRSRAMPQNAGVARRIFGATLVAVAVVLITLLSGADARACPKDVTSTAPATISDKSHQNAKIATGQAQVLSISMKYSAVRLIELTHCCGMTSQSGDFGCPGQCCVACSAAIGATALSLPSPDRSTDRVSLLADWAFSLRPPPLFRPPRTFA